MFDPSPSEPTSSSTTASSRPAAGRAPTRGRPAAARKPAGRPRKSATRPQQSFGPASASGPGSGPRGIVSPADARSAQIQFFVTHLSSVPNKRGVPYAQDTIDPYRDAAASLDAYLNRIGFEGGLDDVDVDVLNGYLADYRAGHTQGGTVTKQGNLRALFKWLVDEYEAAEVYGDPRRHRYSREDEAPPLLSDEFLDDILKATNGRAFLDVRDHAILRVLLTGVRRAEISALQVEDLDLRSAVKTATTGRLKGNSGRPVPLASSTVVALNRWLRTRAASKSRPAPHQGALWISAKGGMGLQDSAIYQMLRRRAEQAGYDPNSIHPHLFRHTAAHEFMANGGQTGDAMQIFGWKDEAMVQRYGRSGAQERALLYAARTGFGERRL